MTKVIYCNDPTVLEDIMELSTYAGPTDTMPILCSFEDAIRTLMHNTPASLRQDCGEAIVRASGIKVMALTISERLSLAGMLRDLRVITWNKKIDPKDPFDKRIYTARIKEIDALLEQLQ